MSNIDFGYLWASIGNANKVRDLLNAHVQASGVEIMPPELGFDLPYQPVEFCYNRSIPFNLDRSVFGPYTIDNARVHSGTRKVKGS